MMVKIVSFWKFSSWNSSSPGVWKESYLGVHVSQAYERIPDLPNPDTRIFTASDLKLH